MLFDYKELSQKLMNVRRDRLECEKLTPHVTFVYAPEFVDTSLFGEEVEVTIIGYGNNGKNEGVLVTLSCVNERLMAMIKNITVPHITLAVSKTGAAVNTKFLDFDPITPIRIVGCYNGHIDEEN